VGKVTAAGFEVLRVTSFMSLLMPLMLAARLRHQQKLLEFDPMVEFNIHPLLNRFLLGVLQVEARFIKKQVSFSAGGSLLLVARRSHM
jgi:hypothetical protein